MKANLECEHFNNIETSTFRFMFEDDQFTDVTLVCEDNQQIRVHKVILSCVSEFIKEIVLRNSHPKPVIYLSQVQIHQSSVAKSPVFKRAFGENRPFFARFSHGQRR